MEEIEKAALTEALQQVDALTRQLSLFSEMSTNAALECEALKESLDLQSRLTQQFKSKCAELEEQNEEISAEFSAAKVALDGSVELYKCMKDRFTKMLEHAEARIKELVAMRDGADRIIDNLERRLDDAKFECEAKEETIIKIAYLLRKDGDKYGLDDSTSWAIESDFHGSFDNYIDFALGKDINKAPQAIEDAYRAGFYDAHFELIDALKAAYERAERPSESERERISD